MHWMFTLVLLLVLGAADSVRAESDVQSGAKLFGQCAACHALEPGRNLTGPSLANLYGRKAGSVSNFLRYSDPLKRSGVIWNEKSLDAWLKDPDAFIPGNEMPFPGIKDDRMRRDLIAYLKSPNAAADARKSAPRMPNLRQAKPGSVVTSLRHCGDTYFVGTQDGGIYKIWEFNLRLKTDGSDHGPAPGKPVILGVGMRGDRTAVVFSSPPEIGAFIRQRCE
jgi:cytochrome c